MAADRRRWWILALGMSAQAASCVFLYGLPYLIPDLRHQFGLSLTGASTLAAAPLVGVIVALVAWGAAADRYGERVVITAGLAIAAGGLIAEEAGALVTGLDGRPASPSFTVAAGPGLYQELTEALTALNPERDADPE